MAINTAKGSFRAQQVLQNYFEFDESDLAANRLGEFSEKQKTALKDEKKDFKNSSILVGVIFTGVGVVILFLLFGLPILQKSSLDWIDVGESLPAILVALVFLGIGVGSLASGFKKATRGLEHGVRKVEGPIKIVQVGNTIFRYPHRRVSVYELRVGKKEFDVYTDLPGVMKQGDVYIVYFDHADETILSAEWISEG
jgi:hypothetical protein